MENDRFERQTTPMSGTKPGGQHRFENPEGMVMIVLGYFFSSLLIHSPSERTILHRCNITESSR